jgi:hypothetical protein
LLIQTHKQKNETDYGAGRSEKSTTPTIHSKENSIYGLIS